MSVLSPSDVGGADYATVSGNPWDMAGGALIVEEAGGAVTDVNGAPFGSRKGSVLATNGRVHAEMLETIRTFTAGFRNPARD